nr:ATP-binding protein [Parapontixanthobacter aurantiacus]
MGAYLGRIASAIAHIDGREGIRVNFDADKIAVPVETAARTGLIFSEVLTNSLQHAFEDRSEGLVEARVKQLSGSTLRISVMDDGTGMPADHDWPNNGNLGSRIVRNLVAGLNGDLNVDTKIKGTTITLDIPLDEQADIIASEQ